MPNAIHIFNCLIQEEFDIIIDASFTPVDMQPDLRTLVVIILKNLVIQLSVDVVMVQIE